MTQLKSFEKKLADVYKSAPALPTSSKESLVKAWPWIALFVGGFQLIAAYILWHATKLVDGVNRLVAFYTAVKPLSTLDSTLMYLGALILLVDGVIMLMAYGPLTRRSSKGWDLLFLGATINLGYGVFSLFVHDRGFSSFISSLVGSAIGFYLLFQIKDKYNGSATKKSVTK